MLQYLQMEKRIVPLKEIQEIIHIKVTQGKLIEWCKLSLNKNPFYSTILADQYILWTE